MDRTSDRQLLARLRASDQSAVQELAQLYGSKIYQLALRQMHNQEDAEEVTQDVLMKVYRNAGAFRGDAALSSWIYRITFNAAMSRLRSGRAARAAAVERDRLISARSNGNDARTSRLDSQADWSSLPDDAVMRAQLRAAVAEAIQELPEVYRVPVVLRDIHGLSTEEASSRLRVKNQTLKSRLHRGRVMLRQRLQAFKSGLSLHNPTPVCC
jgi:RNA polymerase sigma-70 factor, ECF subfamily